MFNKEDILARLTAGDSMDDIAQELTKALNDANAEYIAQQTEATKLEYGNRILQAVIDYITTFHSDSILVQELKHEAIPDETAAEVCRMLDEAVELSEQLAKLPKDLESIFTSSKAPAQLKRDAVHVIDNKDAIAQFLAQHGL